MNDAIHRAAQPGATASSVHLPEHASTLSDPSDSTSYFNALLSKPPILSPRGAVGLLAGPAGHFVRGDATPRDCALYLRAVANNVDGMVEAMKGGAGSVLGGGEGRYAADVLQAVGCAATKCQRRSDVSRSGIIPALARLANCRIINTKLSNTKQTNDGSASSSSPAAASASASGVAVNGTPPKKKSGAAAMDGDSKPKAKDPSAEQQQTQKIINHVLTPAHPEFLQCCLVAGQYRHASSFAQTHPVRMVRPYKCPVTSEQYLRYHYLLGMVHVGCEQIRLALRAFSTCLTVPSQIVSAITIAARKKMLLCRCLLLDEEEDDGDILAVGNQHQRAQAKLLAVPQSASPAVSRFLGSSKGGKQPGASGEVQQRQQQQPEVPAPPMPQPMRVTVTRSGGGGGGGGAGSGQQGQQSVVARNPERNYYWLGVYHDLAAAYQDADRTRFRRIQEENADLFESDGNAGLVKRLGEVELSHRIVRRLSHVYEVMSLKTLAEELGSKDAEEAEGVVLDMVAREDDARRSDGGFLLRTTFSAKIDHGSGMVYFDPDGDEDDCDEEDEEEEWESQRRRADLTRRMEECVQLAERVRSLDVSVTTSARYQQVVMREEASRKQAAEAGSGGGKGGGGGPRGVADLDRPGAFDDF